MQRRENSMSKKANGSVKHFIKRAMSAFMAFVMCLTLLPMGNVAQAAGQKHYHKMYFVVPGYKQYYGDQATLKDGYDGMKIATYYRCCRMHSLCSFVRFSRWPASWLSHRSLCFTVRNGCRRRNPCLC